MAGSRVVDRGNNQAWERAMQLEPKHNNALRNEIGERLKTTLAREVPNLPPHLVELLQRLDELDHDASPSIVPEASPEPERPEPAPSPAWLQRLRDRARRP
jgi:hypothetical protein